MRVSIDDLALFLERNWIFLLAILGLWWILRVVRRQEMAGVGSLEDFERKICLGQPTIVLFYSET